VCEIGLGLTVMGHSLMVGKFAVIVIGQCRRQISVRCETLFKALRTASAVLWRTVRMMVYDDLRSISLTRTPRLAWRIVLMKDSTRQWQE